MNLECSEIAFPTSGGQRSGPAFMYEVRSFSSNQKFFIADFGTSDNPSWKILREVAADSKEWAGNYNSREDALAVIEKEQLAH
jgi:hypothetical protein